MTKLKQQVLLLPSLFMTASALAGLPSNAVNCVHFTHGILAVCTNVGLALSQDDGKTFYKVIGVSNGLPEPSVTNFLIDGESVFIQVASGRVVESHDWVYFGISTKRPTFPSVSDVKDQRGNEYILGSADTSFTFKYIPATDHNAVTPILFPKEDTPQCTTTSGCDGRFTSIEVSGDHRIWLGHSNYGLFYSDDYGDSFVRISSP